MSKLSPAQREDLAVRAYELSLEGRSLRWIGKQLGVSHPTVAALVRQEVENRRKHEGDRLQRTVDMQMKAINRLWEELHKNPSAHSVANLAHALRGLLSDMAKLTGIMPPDQLRHKVEVGHILEGALKNWFAALNDEEFEFLQLLTQKASGDIDKGTDLVALAFERYARYGTLLPKEERRNKPEIIEVVPEEW